MKKRMALLLILSLLLGLCGCGKQESVVESAKESTKASIPVATTQVGEYIIPDEWNQRSLADDKMGYVTSGVELESASYEMSDGYLTALMTEDDGNTLLRLTLDGTEINRITIPRPDIPARDSWYVGYYCFGSDCLWFVEYHCVVIDEESGEISTSQTLKKWSLAGEELVSLPMEAHFGISDDNFLCALELDPEGNPVVLTQSAFLFCDDVGNVISTWETEEAASINFVRDREGRVYVYNFFDNQLYTMDWKNHCLGRSILELDGNVSLCSGGEKYDLLINGQSDLKGVSFAEGTVTEILNWDDLDMAGMVGDVACMDDGTFLVSIYDILLNASQVLTLSQVPVDQIPKKTTVTLAVAMNPMTAEWGGTWVDCLDQKVATQMAGFNRSNDTYRVEVVTFSTAEELQLMILSGDAPDIISWSQRLEVMPSMELYARKGYLVNLGALIEGDPELDMEDFIPSVMEIAASRTGGLYSMPVNFYITTLIGQTEYVGTETGWTWSDMLAMAEQLPEDMCVWSYVSQREALRNLLSGGMESFVDTQEMTCDFQTQEFYDLLRLCRDYFPADIGEEYEVPSGGSMLYGEGVLGRMGQFASDVLRDLEASGRTLIGYPGDTGNGFSMVYYDEYSICALGDQQEGAWKFLRTLYTYDYQYAAGSAFSSVRDDAFNAREDWYLEVNGSCTAEESQIMRDMVYEVKHIRNNNSPFIPIILEEAAAYFAGDKTTEETAQIIENRVKIYLSEQFG